MEWSLPQFVAITRYDLGWSLPRAADRPAPVACTGGKTQPAPAVVVAATATATAVAATATATTVPPAPAASVATAVATVATVAATATVPARPVAATVAAVVPVATPAVAVPPPSGAVLTARAQQPVAQPLPRSPPPAELSSFLQVLEVSGPEVTAESKPIVRDRTFRCLFDWLRTPAAAQVRSYFLVFMPTVRKIRDFYREM
eukprot:SAG31_NODE_1888_length_6987_cov_1.481852_7_plen_202_part_00